jgi:NAD(P)-dependent dehydrogenase (short-subunit alcohol dehydrogenase family)
MLGEAGATVYCTGRSTREKLASAKSASAKSASAKSASVRPNPDAPFELASRPETIEETAEMVAGYGGLGIPVRVDHSDEQQVRALFEKVKAERGGLDILVNDVWGGDELSEWGKPFWELSLEKGLLMLQRGVHTHVITSRYAVPLMLERGAPNEHGSGLIVEITDGDTDAYRGNLFYDLVKTSVIRLAYAMANELRPHGITALAVTPGFLRSEAMLEHFGVTEANWQEGAKKDPHFIASETPYFVGRAVVALATDPNVFQKTGKVLSSWGLAREYGQNVQQAFGKAAQ